MEESTVMAGLLHEIGLSPVEADVYLQLLKEDDVPASKVSSKIKCSRTHVYDALNSLGEKALVNYTIRRGMRYYTAAHPRKLVDYLSEMKTKIDEQKEQIAALVPEFLKLHEGMGKRAKIEIFKGEDGLDSVFRDIMRTGLDFLVLGAPSASDEVLSMPLKRFYRARKKQGVKARLLYSGRSKRIESQLDRSEIFEGDGIPIYIYGDKVAIVLVLEEPVIVVVEEMDFAQRLSRKFEVLWKNAINKG
jgi:sugar-specific transcriptional regulator TrmB